MEKKKIKVLIVDDSAVVRQALTRILNSDPGIEVIGSAMDPFAAAQKMREVAPDVITLDIEMPRMDGLTFLGKIMSQHPIPVVVISSLTAKGTETAVRALELGAVDVLKKPSLSIETFSDSEQRIIDVVKSAAKAVLKRKAGAEQHQEEKKVPLSLVQTSDKVIAVGASTGGTDAILTLLKGMPIDCPGILIVQHMPEVFTRSFAARLNSICKISVKEAENGNPVLRGQALLAPGNKQMELRRSGAKYYVEVYDGPLVNRHRPSVDVLFKSVAHYAGRNASGVIMTGMGADGAQGMLEMKNAGAHTIAQDEKTCVVFGMPKEAIKLDAVDRVLPLDGIAGHLKTAFSW